MTGDAVRVTVDAPAARASHGASSGGRDMGGERLSILVTDAFMARAGQRLEDEADRLGIDLAPIVFSDSVVLQEEELRRVDLAFFTRDRYVAGAQPFFRALEGCDSLRWLHVFHAGVNGDFYRSLVRRGVVLTTSSGSHAEPIAQTVIGALLWFARGFSQWQEAQRDRKWMPLRSPLEPRDLRGQTMIVVGMGAIGTHVGRIAQTLGLHVVGVRRSPREPGDPVDEMRRPEELPELLPRADWLVLACPLTDETRGLIGAEAFERLPDHARVFNVARGAVIDEHALIEALGRGEIAGAYLDVFEQEPLPLESPLWGMPGVIVTPHNSAVSSGNDDRAAEIFLENLRRWRSGEELLNRVEL